MDFRNVLTDDSRNLVADRYVRRQRGEQPPSRYEFSLVRQDSQVRYAEMSATVARDMAGRLRTIGQLVDITERKQAANEREALIAELETQNAELERFTYTVSHDLKSPLITIKGFLGFLKQDAGSGNVGRLEHDIEIISDATETMQRLLDDLLELSRIGRLSNSPEPVPITDLARKAAATVAGTLHEYGVQVRIAPDMPVVVGDRTRLRELYENLIGNAARFMGDQPQPQIEVGTRESDEETIFYVRDNGIGIEAQYQDQIFGLFEKLDPTSEGTGIGLAIVRRIVETHGGRIWVESEGAGHGSTFCFTLPDEGQER
jgi:signal transduction histidine kinase